MDGQLSPETTWWYVVHCGEMPAWVGPGGLKGTHEAAEGLADADMDVETLAVTETESEKVDETAPDEVEEATAEPDEIAEETEKLFPDDDIEEIDFKLAEDLEEELEAD